ncbi:MAG TPA: tetratricopeptide repeat protein, partial [Gemmatimonadales bacterium]|nr:tetratricopeptide repeat protein [Gemmatimonadales bacterium]
AVVDALRHARAHERVLNDELGLPPDPEVTAAAQRLRGASRATATPAPRLSEATPEPVPVAAVPPEAPVTPAPAGPTRATRRTAMAGGALALALLAILGARGALHRREAAAGRSPVVLAVGRIADYSGTERGRLGPPLADMLAINLARGSGYRVISSARMIELERQLRGTGDSTALVAAAARQAGAAELIDGALYAIAPSRFRLDLRRVDLASGSLLGAYRVEGGDLFALADSGVRGLVPDLGGTAPTGSVTQAATSSVVAYQAYEEGLRRLLEGDIGTAERRFRQALDIDSTFAQAAFYYAVATTSGSRSETLDRLRHAVALSRHAGDRERLIIHAEWAAQNSSPALQAIAETLMVRYPEEVDGFYFAGLAANMMGEYARAEAPLKRVLELDSLGFRSPSGGRCRVCEAYSGLGHAYGAIDSLRKLSDLAHEFTRRHPEEAQAWRVLASLYAQEYKPDSAIAALWVADSLEPTNPWNRRYLISVRAVMEQYDEAERLIR